MSLVDHIGKTKLEIADVIIKYVQDLKDVESQLKIEGKSLEKANMEQAQCQFFYDERRSELYSLMKYLEDQVEKVRGNLWKNFTENHSCDLSQRDKDQYINREPKYLEERQIYLQVEELYKKYNAIVEAFSARGYALRNITNLRVSSLENVVL